MVAPRFAPAAFGAPAAALPAKSNRTVVIILATVVVILLIALGALAVWVILPSTSNNKKSGSNEGLQTESSPDVGNTRTSDRSNPPSPTPRAVPPNAAYARQSVVDTLEGWAAAARAHDLNSHMSYFADRLDRYYLEFDVSASHIRATLQPAYDRYYRLDVQLSNIEVSLEPDGTGATVTLDKTYAFTGDKMMSGSVKEMLWLSMANGRWHITGIRDLQVYYQNK